MLGKQGWNDSSKDGNSFGVNCFEGDIILIFILFRNLLYKRILY